MTLDEYATEAARTAPIIYPHPDGLALAALGMAGEAGEFADAVKKIMFHGHPIDVERLAKEVGDVLWYVSFAARALDLSLEEVARRNVEKLRARYPDGFSSKASIERKEEP